jgi:hypothetical protein
MMPKEISCCNNPQLEKEQQIYSFILTIGAWIEVELSQRLSMD